MPTLTDLVDAHSAALYRYLWRLTHDPALAEDYLQETFLRAQKHWAKLQIHPTPLAWLYRTATNLARAGWRQAQRDGPALTPEFPALDPSVLDQVAQRELLQQVARAVEQLPHHQRAALLLRQYQGLEYAAIAATLNCSEASARAHVYQALKKLRKQLREAEVNSHQ